MATTQPTAHKAPTNSPLSLPAEFLTRILKSSPSSFEAKGGGGELLLLKGETEGRGEGTHIETDSTYYTPFPPIRIHTTENGGKQRDLTKNLATLTFKFASNKLTKGTQPKQSSKYKLKSFAFPGSFRTRALPTACTYVQCNMYRPFPVPVLAFILLPGSSSSFSLSVFRGAIRRLLLRFPRRRRSQPRAGLKSSHEASFMPRRRPRPG